MSEEAEECGAPSDGIAEVTVEISEEARLQTRWQSVLVNEKLGVEGGAAGNASSQMEAGAAKLRSTRRATGTGRWGGWLGSRETAWCDT